MLRTFTELVRHSLSGSTMGTRWSAVFDMPADFDPEPTSIAMASVVSEIDAHMSTWKPDSDLMRLSAASPDVWVDVPDRLMEVLEASLAIGRASGGAFDIGVGDAVIAWGFGPTEANVEAIQQALAGQRRPIHEVLEVDPTRRRARKHAHAQLDLSGIAKGYGVDCLAGVARSFGISSALLGIDGELRSFGLQPDGGAWNIAIECPDTEKREPYAMFSLHDAAVATSGDYRHWVEVGDRRFSHTIDPWRGGPLPDSPASVTVVSETCMAADAWATALMVKGSSEGADFARKMNLNALFVDREGEDLHQTPVGQLFEPIIPGVGGAGLYAQSAIHASD